MKTKTFVALKPADDSLPKQAAVIVSVLTTQGGRATYDVLLRGLDGQLKTTQPLARVLSFYRPMLIDRGFVAEEDVDDGTGIGQTAPIEVDPKMKSVSVVEVDFPRDTPLKLKVLRGFRQNDDVILVCGSDVKDHDVWKICGGKALLVGVVRRDQFATLLKTKELKLEQKDFEWVGRPECLPLVGKHANRTTLHSVEEHRFTFEDV